MAANNHLSRKIRRPGLIIGGGIVLLLLLTTVAYDYLGSVAQQVQRAEREIQGLAYLERIRAVIEPLQESRGLLTVRAQNPLAASTVREEQRLAAVESAFAGLLAYHAGQEEDPLGLHAELNALHEEWRQLHAQHTYPGPEQVFDAFTSHIDGLLALHRRAITSSGLDLDPVAGTYSLIQVLDLMLEFVLEPTGQIRALYSAFLAHPTGDGRIPARILGRVTLLDIVSSRIEHHAAMALQARPELTSTLEALPVSLRSSAAQIRDLVLDYPLTSKTTPADVQHFFAAATEIITTGYRLHDAALVATRDGLQERLNEAKAIFRNAIPLFGLIALSAIALVAWGLAGWRQHEQDAKDILQQNHFQRLVAEISASFLHSRGESIDGAISEMLRVTGEFFAVGRSYLFRFSTDGKRMSNTHEWCAPGVTPTIDTMQEISIEKFPWWQERVHELVRAGQLLRIVDIEQLPAEAAAEREILRAQQVRSLCCVPVTINNKVVGFVGFDSLQVRYWNKDRTDHLLTVIANLLSVALERDALERELTRNAITDGLTGLYNRRHFFTHLSMQIEEYRRTRKPFAIAIFDIDHFKRLNDTHGHLVGDCVLKLFAALLLQGFRPFDIVARYGGEEFVAMLTDTDCATAAAISRRVLDATRQHFFGCEEGPAQITVSGGVVAANEIAEQELTPETLVAEADHRLYRAKEQGRDRVVWQGEAS